MNKPLVIGSRGSQLALWQARWISARLAALGRESRIEIIKTSGDQIVDVTLAEVGRKTGGKGVFTKEIEDALLAGTIDLAVHSLKDLPTELPPGLALGVVPERAQPHDALVGKTLDELQPGDVVGSGSPRRAAQILAARPGVEVRGIRGNVDTRLRKRDQGDYDAIVLARAGLERLGLGERIAQVLEPAVMTPAVGQGALGIEIREGDAAVLAAIAPLEDALTRACTDAERALLAALGGGCQTPLGALAVGLPDGTLELQAVVAAPDGSRLVRAVEQGADPVELGRRTALTLRRAGADALLT
ncbi:MAG: hydroxymethylbilane synthase [Acidobacteria bacterium]|nr:hydroxymethylbilane synthase [Acidobacteriota bacterium]